MKYCILIFMAKDRLAAIDIGVDGTVDEISINGNDTMLYASEDEIKEFCQHIKDYYNIDMFSEIEMSISILRFDARMEDVFLLLKEIQNVAEYNLIGAEKILPWIALKEGLLKPGTAVQIRAFDCVYTVTLDNAMILRCQYDEVKSHPFEFPREKFARYNHLDKKGLLGNEDEKRELQQKLVEEFRSRNTKIKELESQVADEKKKTKKAEDNLKRIEAESHEKERNVKRCICRLRCVTKEKDRKYVSLHSLESREKLDPIFFEIEYFCSNGEFIEQNQKIAKIKVTVNSFITPIYSSILKASMDLVRASFNVAENEEFIIRAEMPGRLFWLKDSSSRFEYGSDIALIGDISDTKEDVMKWYEKMK